jgi:hypothetical protein
LLVNGGDRGVLNGPSPEGVFICFSSAWMGDSETGDTLLTLPALRSVTGLTLHLQLLQQLHQQMPRAAKRPAALRL